MDIAQFQGKNYVVISDFISRCLKVDEIKGKTVSEIIEKLIQLFGKFGIPKNIVADINPFSS